MCVCVCRLLQWSVCVCARALFVASVCPIVCVCEGEGGGQLDCVHSDVAWHATVLTHGIMLIWSLQSKNGTLLNGKKMLKEHAYAVGDGDLLCFGTHHAQPADFYCDRTYHASHNRCLLPPALAAWPRNLAKHIMRWFVGYGVWRAVAPRVMHTHTHTHRCTSVCV